MIIIALVINSIIELYEFKKIKLKLKSRLWIIGFETLGLIIGSKVLDYVIYADLYNCFEPSEMIFEGFIFFGGIVLSIILITLYCMENDLELEKILNIVAHNVLLIYSISKIGCFFNNCCNGILVNNYFRFPVQLFESTFCFISYFSVKKVKNKFPISCILYGTIRIFLSFLREKVYLRDFIINEILGMATFIIGFIIILKKKHLIKST